MQKARLLFEKYVHASHWVCLIIAIAFIFRIPSFFEPFYYGDEMIYMSLGQGIKNGFTLYKDIHDNKPPLLYYIASISNNIFWFKVVLAFWASATIIFFWRLAEALFKKNKIIVYSSVAIFAFLTTIPSFEGNIANAENFMIGFTILGFLILTQKNLNFNKIYSAGFLIGVATLFKMPALFDIGAVTAFWFITLRKYNLNNIKKFIINNFYLYIGLLTPILITMLWFFSKGALTDYLIAAFGQNIGYLSSWRPSEEEKSFLIKNAPLLFRSLIVLISFIIIFLARNKLSKQFILISLWSITSIFAVTLSERPYPHYLIQSMPSFSILVGILIGATTIEQTLTLFPILLTIITPFYYKFWIYPTLSYYNRFVLYSTKQISYNEYLNRFDKNLNRDYKVAKIISLTTNKNDNVFVFANESARVYAISQRLPKYKYIAAYHINDFSNYKNVYQNFLINMPDLIVVSNEILFNSDIDNLIQNNYLLMETIEEIKIYKKITTP